MLFKDFLNAPCGLRYMLDSLQLMSGCGRSRLLGSPMMTCREAVASAYGKLRSAYDRLYGGEGKPDSVLASLKHRLMCLRDIGGTMSRLDNGVVLDDIDLFEIKYLALLAGSVREYVAALALDCVDIPDLAEVADILDPDGMRVESFYVYDSYSEELAGVRRELKRLGGAAAGGGDAVSDPRLPELMERERLIERDVREHLSKRLAGYSARIKRAVDELADLDVLLAKSLQIKETGLCFPEIASGGTTRYAGMFHPQIAALYEARNREAGEFGGERKEFTPIDIEFSHTPVTIIGANMGGKTVVLKMVAMNQLLFQFGFGIAAREAEIEVKDEVRICIGDEQDELSGLSSFAGEIRAINGVIESAERGTKLLALIDEPARTTNPIDGTALVAALLGILREKDISLLITTHYNVPGGFFGRLRVNGLTDGRMDYRLSGTESGDIPHEAINIAKSLKVNDLWIAEAEKILDRNN